MIWDALKGASEADTETALVILESAGITFTNHSLHICYDERGGSPCMTLLYHCARQVVVYLRESEQAADARNTPLCTVGAAYSINPQVSLLSGIQAGSTSCQTMCLLLPPILIEVARKLTRNRSS